MAARQRYLIGLGGAGRVFAEALREIPALHADLAECARQGALDPALLFRAIDRAFAPTVLTADLDWSRAEPSRGEPLASAPSRPSSGISADM